MLTFETNPLWMNLLVFAIGAMVIWFAGTKLERYVDEIAGLTGLGRAFAGLLLLAGATSLPEIATTVTASAKGNAPLAVNNLMGGIAMQTAILAVADWTLARGKLTYFTPRFTLLLQGVALLILLGIAIACMVSGEYFSVWGIGAWPFFIMMAFLLLLYKIYLYRGNPRWQPVNMDEWDEQKEPAASSENEPNLAGEDDSDVPPQHRLPKMLLLFGAGSAAILVAGWTVTSTAEVLIDQLQLSASFVGAVLVAIATSLPEVSTTTAAVRAGNYSMAISNIFGSNMIMLALLFVAELSYRQGSILTGGGQQAIFMAALGMVVTGVYLWGLLAREKRTFLRIGADSAVVLLLYLGSLAVLYKLG